MKKLFVLVACFCGFSLDAIHLNTNVRKDNPRKEIPRIVSYSQLTIVSPGRCQSCYSPVSDCVGCPTPTGDNPGKNDDYRVTSCCAVSSPKQETPRSEDEE